MPWVVGSYPQHHVGGAPGILAALLALLGQKLTHWSVRESPCGTSEVVLQVTELPESLALSELVPVWKECSEDAAMLEATAHQTTMRRLPPLLVQKYGSKLRAELELYENDAKAEALAEEAAAAPVQFGTSADTLGNSIAPGVYLTATPTITDGYVSVPVRVLVSIGHAKEGQYLTSNFSANFCADENTDGCFERLVEIWGFKDEYPVTMRRMQFSVHARWGEPQYELELFLTALAGNFPEETFESWICNGEKHSFRQWTACPFGTIS